MRKYKVLLMVLLVSVFFCIIVVKGDTITFISNKTVDPRILDVTSEYIEAVFLRKDVKSLHIQFSSDRDYSDELSLHIPEVTIGCKIRELTPDLVRVLIPLSSVSSIQMPSQSNDKQDDGVSDMTESKSGMTAGIVHRGGRLKQGEEGEKSNSGILSQMQIDERVIVDQIRTPSNEREELIKDYRLRIQKTRVKPEDFEAENDLVRTTENKENIVRDTRGESEKGLENDQITEPVRIDSGKERYVSIHGIRFGKVEGRIVERRDFLAGCYVKLQLLERFGLLSKRYRPLAGAVEFEAITDENGVYLFENIPAGEYKIYWKPPSETEWIGRFKMEPDVIVEPGKLTNPQTIEILKRTLN
ncbi:MAG: carboxypeptidase-like regulatory domain-containing protein [Candidatus Loosdrechtia sp.]|uniref:carboxypeptidase-like regulatory domain-containing protein n=1 Tax=Candidatus Loosdrechtia sp. TaxID=3101272 RepID=UPI003A63D107|nr:MAG: carboxypeptidase-like regulatory domain-containing protein [Candidatus Jettenia sp. AMX2]